MMQSKMQTVKLKVGESITVRFPGHAASGYEWFFFAVPPA